LNYISKRNLLQKIINKNLKALEDHPRLNVDFLVHVRLIFEAVVSIDTAEMRVK